MTARPTPLRTLTAALVVVAGSLTLATGPASAAPSPASTTNGHCRSMSPGESSWTEISVIALKCSHGDEVAHSWAAGCDRPDGSDRRSYCTVVGYVNHRDVHFICGSHRYAGTPARYRVGCEYSDRESRTYHAVSFTFQPHAR